MDDKPIQPASALGLAIKDIYDKATHAEELVTAYSEHVHAGGDPTKLPRSEDTDQRELLQNTWYNTPVKPYAQSIVNDYRVEQGVEINPYHPASDAFNLFDELRADWKPAKYGPNNFKQLVKTVIKDVDLAPHGLCLVDKTEDGSKLYKIVKIAVD